MKQLFERLTSPTPEFHAKARNLFLILGAVIAVAIATKPGFIPEGWFEILKFIDAIFIATGVYAQTASTKH